MAVGRRSGRLAAMTHILSVEPGTASLAARALNVARFVLHFGQMVLAMHVGMLIYMPLESFIPTALDAARQQLGVLLYDGVSEFGLAGLLDEEVGSTSANTFVMAPEL